MEIEPYSYSQGPVGSYASRIGINRNTWRAGQTIGRAVKRWLNKRGRPTPQSNPRPAKKQRTAQKSTIQTGRVMNEGTGGQCSVFRGPFKKSFLPKYITEVIAPQKIQSASAWQIKSVIGKQNIISPLSLFLPSLATSYTGDKFTRVLYEKATAEFTMNNIYLSNAYIIIYDIFARKDFTTAVFTDPVSAWTQGDTDEGAATAPTFLGSTPWNNELFNEYFRVSQVTKVVLAAGATHVHKINLNPNRVVSSAYAQYTNGGLKDVSYWCMVEVHGSPANDVTTQAAVSIGVGGLNIVVDYEQTLKQLLKATPTITAAAGLSTTLAGGEQVVNLGGSTITVNAEG